MRASLSSHKGLAARRLLLVVLAPLCLGALFNLAMTVAAVLESSLYVDDPYSWRSAGQIVGRPPGDEPSVLLLHGFVGSPLDMKPLAQALADEGFRVVVPVVPGQVALDSALSRGDILPQDYLNWLHNQILHEIEVTGHTPHVVGFSMGGALATLIAREAGVERLVLIAPYYGLSTGDSLATRLARSFSFLAPLVPKLSSGRINDPTGREHYSSGSYIISTRAFLHLQVLAKAARNEAVNLDMDVLAIVSESDQVASPSIIREALEPAPHTRILSCGHSNHVLLYDHDRDLVIRSVADFLTSPDPSSLSFPEP